MTDPPPRPAGDDAEACARSLRDLDHDRFIANLFAPGPARRRLNALFAFAAALAAVPDRASEPLVGQIRLQWWRDTVRGLAGAGRTGHPVADELAQALGAGLAVDELLALVEARERELAEVPVASLAELERHFGETVGAPMAAAARVLGAEAEAASVHAGAVLGLTALVTAPGRKRRAVFLPADLMRRHGLTAGEDAEDRHMAAFASDLVAGAQHHLAETRAALAEAPRALLPAFLPLAAAAHDLDRLAARPLRRDPRLPRWRRQLAMWRAARRGRV